MLFVDCMKPLHVYYAQIPFSLFKLFSTSIYSQNTVCAWVETWIRKLLITLHSSIHAIDYNCYLISLNSCSFWFLSHLLLCFFLSSGLSAAYKLKLHGLNVTVFEADGRAGGKLRSISHDGLIWDEGANTMVLHVIILTSNALPCGHAFIHFILWPDWKWGTSWVFARQSWTQG